MKRCQGNWHATLSGTAENSTEGEYINSLDMVTRSRTGRRSARSGAKELKAAGMDWAAVLVAEDQNPRERIAAEVLASSAYDSTAARVNAFIQQGGGCRGRFSTTAAAAGMEGVNKREQ